MRSMRQFLEHRTSFLAVCFNWKPNASDDSGLEPSVYDLAYGAGVFTKASERNL